MEKFVVQCREDVICFMQEMMTRFSKDHVSDLMKHRRVEECEELSLEYIKDGRFTVIAEYLIEEGSIDATVADFKTDEPLNLMMFFYCFDEEYNGAHFTDLHILSEEAYVAYVKSLATSDIEVEKETAMLLLGVACEEELENYDYSEYDPNDEYSWHISELTLAELIDCADPAERIYNGEEDEAEKETEE